MGIIQPQNKIDSEVVQAIQNRQRDALTEFKMNLEKRMFFPEEYEKEELKEWTDKIKSGKYCLVGIDYLTKLEAHYYGRHPNW